MLKQEQWFEMNDLKRRNLVEASWVPLCRYERIINGLEYGHLGFEEEYFGAVAVVFPVGSEAEALRLIPS